MPRVEKPVFFVIGSTGSGKSKVAVEVALELKQAHNYTSVVIVNCDVYQCFRDLPVSTNKPSPAECGGVPHVGLGFLDSKGSVLADCDCTCVEACAFRDEARAQLRGGSAFNVHAYQRIVSAFVAAFFQRNIDGAVVICGGTCYYAQSLLFADALVNEGTPITTSTSSEDAHADDNLWERLKAADPTVAARYHPNDRRRIKRLLDIHEATGCAPSSIFDAQTARLRLNAEAVFVLWVRMERGPLDLCLDERVDAMVERGMLGEIEEFWTRCGGRLPNSSLSEAIGCKEFAQYFHSELQPSPISDEDVLSAVEQVKSNTRRYARQQERWIQNRLLALLHASPLKPLWRHFVVLWVRKGVDVAAAVRCTLGEALADSSDSSCVDESLFPLRRELATRQPVSQETCDACGAIVYGRGQMELHLKSKRHRGALKRLALEKEQLEKYGRELPPPKRKRSG